MPKWPRALRRHDATVPATGHRTDGVSWRHVPVIVPLDHCLLPTEGRALTGPVPLGVAIPYDLQLQTGPGRRNGPFPGESLATWAVVAHCIQDGKTNLCVSPVRSPNRSISLNFIHLSHGRSVLTSHGNSPGQKYILDCTDLLGPHKNSHGKRQHSMYWRKQHSLCTIQRWVTALPSRN